MSAAIWFWILFVICLLFGGYMSYPFEKRSSIWIVVFVLIGLLGYRVFGSPIQ